MTDRRARPGRHPAGRPLRAGPRRPHLPDLGADLRLQPGLRALPVELRPAGPSRAVDRGVQGAHRRVRADADLLRQHRRGRAHHPVRLLGPRRLRHRPPRRRRSSRPTARGSPRRWPPAWPPATTSTSRSPSTAPPPTSTTPCGAPAPSPRRVDRHGAPGRRRLRRLQALGGGHPPQRRPARRLQGHRRPLRGPAPAHPAAAVGAGRRRAGTSSTRRPTSSASSTTGWCSGARRCSPATRSSTSPATATPCPASTCAGPAGWSAWSTRSATSTPAPSPSTTSSWPATCATPAGFASVWRESDLFTELREPQSAGACGSCGHYDACRGGCMAAKFFTGLPLDGPDPECVLGHGEHALDARGDVEPPRPVARPLVPSAEGGGRPAPRPVAGRAPERPRPPAGPQLRRAPAGRLRARARPVAPVTDLDRTGRPSAVAPPPPGWCSGPTRPTSARGGPSATATSPTTRPGPPAAPASSSPRRPRCTRRTGPTSGPRWPRPVRPGWAAVAEACRPARHRGPGRARPRRAARGRAPSPSPSCGPRPRWPTWSAARCRWPWAGPRLDALVDGFAAAAEAAVDAGLDGVEIDAGPLSVLRQFHSGLTNQRDRRLRRTTACSLTREVLDAVRDAVGPDRIVGPAAVVRRAGPVGRGDPRAGRRPGRRPGRPDRPADRGPRRALLGHRLPARRPHAGRVQPRAVRGHAPGGRPAGCRWSCRAAWSTRPWPRPRWTTASPTWWR